MEGVYVEYLGYTLPLPLGETVIGRDVQCSLRFNDPSVSRRHVRLIRRQDEVFIEDLGSSNGTLLNGRRLAAPLKLADGDNIQIGSRDLIVRISDEPQDVDTLVLKPNQADPFKAQVLGGVPSRGPSEVVFGRAVTAQMAVVVPPALLAHQRCPKCGAPVSEFDDECANCRYTWGDFRPASRTDVRPSSVIRRRHPREAIALPLQYVSSELEIEATTRDLSEGGVFVCSQVLDPIGTRCHLTILIDGGPPLTIYGVVRRVVEHGDELTGLGVQFVQVTAEQLAWIRAVIARMRGDEDGDGAI